MVKVFKTNVEDPAVAEVLLSFIHQNFEGCQASFDLEDCDRILRVKCRNGSMQPPLISFLGKEGFMAEAL